VLLLVERGPAPVKPCLAIPMEERIPIMLPVARFTMLKPDPPSELVSLDSASMLLERIGISLRAVLRLSALVSASDTLGTGCKELGWGSVSKIGIASP
jgi:hypothetical protein